MATRAVVEELQRGDYTYDSFDGMESSTRGRGGVGGGAIRHPPAPPAFSRYGYMRGGYDDVLGGGRDANCSPSVVAGRDRMKFFRKPLLPFLKGIPPEAVIDQPVPLHPLPVERESQMAKRKPRTAESRTKTVSIQTDYRESDAQTDPFTPDYIVPDGHDPEVLALANLSYGRGLPAGKDEIELIDRIRRRRKVEASLPPMSLNEKDMMKRMKMLQDLETMEWDEREQQMKVFQEEKLKLVEAAYHEREKERELMSVRKLASIKARQKSDVQKMRDKAHIKKLQTVRKLGKGLDDQQKRRPRRDIIEEYADEASKVYAPPTRLGAQAGRNAYQYEYDSYLMQSVEGIHELEMTCDRMGHTKARIPSVQSIRAKNASKPRKVLMQELDLAKVHETITMSKQTEETFKDGKEDILSRYKASPRVVRPSTPMLEDDVNDDEEIAIIFLQRLLRGRAAQNMMFEGKEKRLDLIKELVEVEKVKQEERDKSDQIEAEEHRHRAEHAIETTLDAIKGEIVGRTLDFLSKELVRRHEERRIADLELEAKAERKSREASESSLRQKEEKQRHREEEQYREVIGVHAETAITFVDEIVRRSVESSASKQAVLESQLKRELVSQGVIEPIEESSTAARVVARDLMAALLLPTVERKMLRDQLKIDQRKYLAAAHEEIYRVMRDVPKD